MSLPASESHSESHPPPLPSHPATDARGRSFPFSLRRPIQPNPSSTSLVPSIAQGKPIPVDDSTVEYRTTALRELNNHYPSRHRYAKSSGARSSTYSEPVIVRSYYPPPAPSRPPSLSRAAIPTAGATHGLPFASKVVSAGNGMLSSMVLARAKKPVNARAEAETRLPPIEAFSFKSFMANMEAQDGGAASDINADLDRIAEICARSRYSLSNQYEVHYASHGSGASFLAAGSQPNDAHGPTLQAVPSDDERSAADSARRRRRMGARRNSRAMGTLETIMSSSRSSEEERAGKNMTAAEIAEEVRGRAARKDSGHASSSNSSRGTPERRTSQHEESPSKPLAAPRQSASSLALIDASRHNPSSADTSNPRTSATALVSEPALPQASTSHLEIRTAPGEPREEPRSTGLPAKGGHAPPKQMGLSVAKGAITPMGIDTAGSGILSVISGWIPWRSSTAYARPKGLAEGSLRELLKVTGLKGKGLER